MKDDTKKKKRNKLKSALSSNTNRSILSRPYSKSYLSRAERDLKRKKQWMVQTIQPNRLNMQTERDMVPRTLLQSRDSVSSTNWSATFSVLFKVKTK